MDRGMASRMKKLLIALSFGYDGDHGGSPGNARPPRLCLLPNGRSMFAAF
jgi:hypothetical protein